MSNVMEKAKIGKIILSAASTGTDLDKAVKLLEMLSSMKPQVIKAGPRRRIPAFGVRPGLPLGTKTTLRGKEALAILRKLLGAIDNTIKKKQIADNHLSFGIKEYIEIPGVEYERNIGIRGFNTTIVFEKPGLRVKKRKIKTGNFPKKQQVSPEEIMKFMEENFKTKFE